MGHESAEILNYHAAIIQEIRFWGRRVSWSGEELAGARMNGERLVLRGLDGCVWFSWFGLELGQALIR